MAKRFLGSGRRLALALVLAVALGGALVGVAVAAHLPGAVPTSSSTSSSPAPTARPFPGGFPGVRGHGFGAHGGLGTVTAIDSATRTITLRTLFGQLRVTTTSSTVFSKEHRTISFSGIHPGDVLAVVGTPSAGSTRTSGTVAASRVIVEVPTVAGRVQSVSGNTITVVNEQGQLVTVTTTGTTRYYGRGQAAATSASVQPGVFILAEGTRNSLTHLTADDIAVLPGLRNGFGYGPGSPSAGRFPPGPMSAVSNI